MQYFVLFDTIFTAGPLAGSTAQRVRAPFPALSSASAFAAIMKEKARNMEIVKSQVDDNDYIVSNVTLEWCDVPKVEAIIGTDYLDLLPAREMQSN